MTRVKDVYLKIGSVTGNQTAWTGPTSQKRIAQVSSRQLTLKKGAPGDQV